MSMPQRRNRLAIAGLAVALAMPFGAHSASPLVNVGPFPGLDQVALAPDGLKQALAELPAIVQDIIERSQVPGVAVAVVHNGNTVFAQGFGVRQLGKPAPVIPETVFLIASLSKSLTGSLIATQISAGKVQWHDPVVKYLPGFRLANNYVSQAATIGDFMAHRSGLPGAAGDDLEDLGYSRNEILSRLHLLPLDDFRTSYHYANFGTTTAAEAVAAAAGMPWESLIQTALFQPLGMTSSSARHRDFIGRSNRAVQHAFEDGRFQALYDRNADAQSPAGGVSSNVLDMANWMKFMLASGRYNGQQLATAEALLQATQPQAFSGPMAAPDARPGFYGYGFNVGIEPNGRVLVSHSGAFLLGTGTHYRLLPSANVGIVVLTNGSPVGVAESIAAEFTDRVQYGKPLRDWFSAYQPLFRGLLAPVGDLVGQQPPATARSAGDLAVYAGTYHNDYYGPATITAQEQSLYLALGPGGLKVPLKPWDGDTFAIAPVSENEAKGSLSSVKFAREPGGVAHGFVVEYLNGNGLGQWRRAGAPD
ncbi:serine hydrolase [Pusillimonas minor]|uniref:Serine hydrolase n=1 Tax=Pusillimonas minor TaxID=2697024 RepID=A0A842HP63_9BURK|nr:serine hydrolase [Pusillimonas minor]MBC2770097.1 serine hydrolase [Pusillimonas minor]